MDDTSKVMVFDGWDFQPASAFPQLGSVGSPNHGRQQDDPPAHAIRECDCAAVARLLNSGPVRRIGGYARAMILRRPTCRLLTMPPSAWKSAAASG